MGIHREIHTSIMLHVIKIDRKCQELIVPGGLNFWELLWLTHVWLYSITYYYDKNILLQFFSICCFFLCCWCFQLIIYVFFALVLLSSFIIMSVVLKTTISTHLVYLGYLVDLFSNMRCLFLPKSQYTTTL